MGKSVIGMLLILGGAVAGVIGFGLLFAAALAVLGQVGPGERGAAFGLTFGLLGGVGVAAAAMERTVGENEWGKMILPGILALALAVLAVYMLFSGGAWSRIFAGSSGGVVVVAWVLICGWLARKLGGTG